MAAAASMQSILAANPSSARSVNRNVGLPAGYYVPRRGKRMDLRVRSTSEEKETEESKSPASTVPPAEPAKFTQPNPVSKPKMSTQFSDLFSFSGPAPERINGRLAMIGFVAAMGVELTNGHDIFAQISTGGVPWFLGTSAVLTLASLIPLFQGISPESKSSGFMSSDAELWNGRFAMLGLIALAFTEYVKGGALI